MPVTIREGQPTDSGAIHQVHTLSIRKICSLDYSDQQIESWASALEPQGYVRAMNAGEHMFVALSDGEIVGFSSVMDAEVKAVYVHPDHIGSGVGAALLSRAEQEIRARGRREARLSSTITAREFYLAHGWQLLEETIHELRGGMSIPCFAMMKKLED